MSVAVITGASRGLGRSIAQAVAAVLSPSVLVLAARDADGLQDTAKLVSKARATVDVRIVALDVAEPEGVRQVYEATGFSSASAAARPSRCLLVHNAGSLSPLGAVSQLARSGDVFAQMQHSCALNISSPIALTSAMLTACMDNGGSMTVVNISSLAALQPFVTWGAYCSHKASRDMYMRVLAEEAKQYSLPVRCLSYAPGPLDTAMQGEIRDSASIDADMRAQFSAMHVEGRLVSPDASARVLADLLHADEFENGAHVDYFDVAK